MALRSSAKPSLARWLLAVGIDWAVLWVALFAPGLAVEALGWPGLLVVPLAILVIGARQQALGVLGHEGAHRIITPNRPLNDGLAQFLCFWPVAADLDVYRPFHLTHHRKLNTPADPENDYRRAGAPHYDLPYSARQLVVRCLVDLLGGGFPEAGRIRQFMGPQSVRAAVGPLSIAAILTVVGVKTGHWWIPLLWYWSLGTSFVCMWRIRGWLEHTGTESTHRVHLPLWLRPIIAPHNVWIHWEHHTLAYVPWWALPELRAQAPDVPVVGLGELFDHYSRHPRVASGTPSVAADAP